MRSNHERSRAPRLSANAWMWSFPSTISPRHAVTKRAVKSDENTCVHEAGFNEVLTIFDILFYSKEDACLSGEYTVMQNLSRVQTTGYYAGKGMFSQSEEYWDPQPEKLAAACERLGGVPAGKGDVAYRIPVFQNINMLLQFWQSDEEFPASMQFQFDQNLLQFMHYETAWYVVSHCLELLKQ